MTGVVQVSELLTRVRQESDMVNSQFCTDSEITGYIANSYKELYDLLASAYGEDYYVAVPVQITTDGVNATYALPDGVLYSAAVPFYKLLGVDYQLAPNNPSGYVTLKTFPFSERNRYAVPNFASTWGFTNLRYRLQGNLLWFSPLPAANQVVQIWYIPRPVTLVNLTDTLDGISGWEEYVVIDAAIKCLLKEESEVGEHKARKAAILARIESMAANRDPGTPAQVADVSGNPWDTGGNFGQ